MNPGISFPFEIYVILLKKKKRYMYVLFYFSEKAVKKETILRQNAIPFGCRVSYRSTFQKNVTFKMHLEKVIGSGGIGERQIKSHKMWLQK